MKHHGWFSWKNEDEMKSKVLNEDTVELNLTVKMTVADFAGLVDQFARKDFFIEITKIP